MKYSNAFIFLIAFLFNTAGPAFSQDALGVNYHQFLQSIQEQELNQIDATWLRGFIDMHLLGDQDPAQNPNIQAILAAGLTVVEPFVGDRSLGKRHHCFGLSASVGRQCVPSRERVHVVSPVRDFPVRNP